MTVNCMEFNLPPSDGWRSESNTEQWKPLAPRSLCWFKPTPKQANHPSSQLYIITACDFRLIFFPSCDITANCVIDEHQNNGQCKKNLFVFNHEVSNYKIICDTDIVMVVSREMYGKQCHQHKTERQTLEKRARVRITERQWRQKVKEYPLQEESDTPVTHVI